MIVESMRPSSWWDLEVLAIDTIIGPMRGIKKDSCQWNDISFWDPVSTVLEAIEVFLLKLIISTKSLSPLMIFSLDVRKHKPFV